MPSVGRDVTVGRLCQLIELALERRRFTKHDAAEALGVHHRTAHRHLLAMEASGLVAVEREAGRGTRGAATIWTGGWRLRHASWQAGTAA